MDRPLIVAITGATGVVYGVEMLRVLRQLGQETHLIISESAGLNLKLETDHSLEEVRALAHTVYSNKDVGAAVASGSFRTKGMIVAPCSIKTLSGIANSFASNLIVRAADVTLKEQRKLVLMVRETPLHRGHLDLMVRAADSGAVLLPPMPAFYQRPTTLMDIVHHSVGRALDQVGIDHALVRRWAGHGPDERRRAG